MSAEQDGHAGDRRLPGDSAHAWFESLSLVAQSPQGEQKPSDRRVLRKPFRLTFDARGRVKLVEAPAFPRSSRRSAIWRTSSPTCSSVSRRSRCASGWRGPTRSPAPTRRRIASCNATSITNYKVEKDTVVNGTPALIVRMTQHTNVHAEGPVPTSPARAPT